MKTKKDTEKANQELLREIEQLKAKVAVLEKYKARQEQAEEELRESDKRFRVALMNSGITIFTQDCDLRFTWAYNPIAGFDAGKILGKTDEDLIGAEQASDVVAVKRRVLETGKSISKELSTVVGEKTIYYILNIEPLLDSNGETTGIVCASINITARKQAEVELKEHRDHLEELVDERTHLLKESENRIRNLLENIPIGISLSTPDGKVPEVNEATWKTFGYGSKEEFVNVPAKAHYYNSKDREQFVKLLEKGPVKGLEMRLKRKDGTLFWGSVTSLHMVSETGKTEFLNVFEDITERKQSEDQLRAIADYTYDWESWFAQNGQLIWLNPAVEKLTGYSMKECRDMPDYPLPIVHKDNRAEFGKLLQKAIEEKHLINDFEFKITHKSGSVKWMAVSWQPIYDVQNKHIGQRTSVRDITERKEAEKKLEEKERYFRSILYSIHEDIIVIDSEHRIVDINNTALTTTGFKHDEVIGKPCFEISHGYNVPCDQMGESCAMKKVFETGQNAQCIHEHLKMDGSKVHVDILFSPMKDADGKVTHVIETVRDISDIIKVQNELQKTLEREQSLADIVRNAPMGIAFGYPDGRLENCNAAFSELTGYSLDELQDITWSKLLTPDKWIEPEIKELEKLSPTNNRVHYEKEYIRKDGKVIPVELVVTAKFDEKGNMLHYVGFVMDISERKLTEEALKENERRLTYSQQIAKLGYWDWNIVTGGLYWSDETFRHFGFKPQELVPTFERFSTIVHPDDLESVEQQVQAALNDNAEYNINFRFARANGEIGYLHTRGEVTRDEKGKPIRFVGSQIDITELKHAEEELRKNELLLRNTFEALEEAVFVVTSDKVLIRSNKSAEKMLGYKHEEFANNSMEVFHVDYDHYVEFEKQIVEAFIEGKSANFEFRLKRKNGEIFPTEHTVSFLRNNGGNPFGLVSVVRDISERKQAEEELKKHRNHLEELVKERTKDLEAFSYSISHDLRAPLRAISGFSEILSGEYKDKLDDEAKRIISIIRKNAKDMNHLITDLLEFSRLGRQKLKTVKINMKTLAREVSDELKQIYTKRNIDFKLGEIPSAIGDKNLTRLVFMNLISNAIKFTEHKKIAEIEVGFREKDKQAFYYVKDNGAGFDMKYAAKLFGVFQRLHTSEEFEGTGVGLAIVHKIIQKHGGKVWAEAEVDKGAAFYFSLPGS